MGVFLLFSKFSSTFLSRMVFVFRLYLFLDPFITFNFFLIFGLGFLYRFCSYITKFRIIEIFIIHNYMFSIIFKRILVKAEFIISSKKSIFIELILLFHQFIYFNNYRRQNVEQIIKQLNSSSNNDREYDCQPQAFAYLDSRLHRKTVLLQTAENEHHEEGEMVHGEDGQSESFENALFDLQSAELADVDGPQTDEIESDNVKEGRLVAQDDENGDGDIEEILETGEEIGGAFGLNSLPLNTLYGHLSFVLITISLAPTLSFYAIDEQKQKRRQNDHELQCNVQKQVYFLVESVVVRRQNSREGRDRHHGRHANELDQEYLAQILESFGDFPHARGEQNEEQFGNGDFDSNQAENGDGFQVVGGEVVGHAHPSEPQILPIEHLDLLALGRIHEALESEARAEVGVREYSFHASQQAISDIEKLREFFERVMTETGLGWQTQKVVEKGECVKIDNVDDEVGNEKCFGEGVHFVDSANQSGRIWFDIVNCADLTGRHQIQINGPSIDNQYNLVISKTLYQLFSHGDIKAFQII